MVHTKVDQAEKEAMLKGDDMPSEYTKLDTGEEESPTNEEIGKIDMDQNNQTQESHHSSEPPKVDEQSTHNNVPPKSESTENQAIGKIDIETHQSHHTPDHNTSHDPHSSSTTQQPSNS